jgi:outer membrane lipoprotein carrier protein
MKRAMMIVGFMLMLPTGVQADDFDKLVEDVETFYAKQQDFSARFTQTVTRAHLPDRPVTKTGTVYFKKPGKMRWDYVQPDKVYYVSDGTHLWNYIPESKLVYKMKVGDSELFYALRFLYGEGKLRKDFDLSDGGQEKELRIIRLKPRESEHNFQELKLFVVTDDEGSRIAQTELLDPADNVSRLVFEKISYQALPDKGFVFEAPPDVQIEDLSAPPVPQP